MNWQGTEAQFALVQDRTGIGAEEWMDVLALPTPEATREAIADWAALGRMSWATARPDVVAEVLAALGVIGTIAGVVSGVAGAVSAVNALRSL